LQFEGFKEVSIHREQKRTTDHSYDDGSLCSFEKFWGSEFCLAIVTGNPGGGYLPVGGTGTDAGIQEGIG